MSYKTKILITSCLTFYLWYAQHIGKEFEIEKIEDDKYWVREPDEYRLLNWVHKEDATILKD